MMITFHKNFQYLKEFALDKLFKFLPLYQGNFGQVLVGARKRFKMPFEADG